MGQMELLEKLYCLQCIYTNQREPVAGFGRTALVFVAVVGHYMPIDSEPVVPQNNLAVEVLGSVRLVAFDYPFQGL